MVQIVLVRPGSCDYDEQGRLQGQLNIPLNAQGNQDVAHLIDVLGSLGVEAVFAANSEPTEQTGEQIARALGVKFKALEKLPNVNLGLWEGMLVDEVKRKHPKVFRRWEELEENVCPPQGETLGEARARVVKHLQRLVKKHPKGRVAVVAPAPLSNLIVACLTEGDLGEDWEICESRANWDVLAPREKTLVASGNGKKA